MEDLGSRKEKDIIKSVLLEKTNSTNNKISPYTICTLQDLYDMTSIRNSTNIDLAAKLIYDTAGVKVFVQSDENIKKLFKNICNSFNLIKLKAVLLNYDDDFTLDKNETVLIFKDDVVTESYKNFLSESKTQNVKVINILSEKNKVPRNNEEINLYHLDCGNFDKLLCLEILLNCVYFGILTKSLAYKVEA